MRIRKRNTIIKSVDFNVWYKIDSNLSSKIKLLTDVNYCASEVFDLVLDIDEVSYALGVVNDLAIPRNEY